MVDIFVNQEAFVMAWVKRFLQDENPTWKIVSKMILSKIGHDFDIFSFNSKLTSIKPQIDWAKVPLFYEFLIKTWYKYKTCDDVIFNNSCLWNNFNITYKRNVIFFKSWKNVGIKYIHDVVDNQGKLKCINVFKEMMPNNAAIMLEYFVVQQALLNKNIIEGHNEVMYNNIIICKSRSRDFKQLIIKKEHILPIAVQRWNAEYQNLNWTERR